MEFLRAIGPVFNFLLLAGALFFLTRKRIRKRSGGVHPVGAGGVPCIAHKNFSAKVGAGGDDHALCAILPVQLGDDALHMAVLHLDGNDFRLMDSQPRRQLKGVLHIFMIALAVGLDAQSVDSGAFALVEHPAL